MALALNDASWGCAKRYTAWQLKFKVHCFLNMFPPICLYQITQLLDLFYNCFCQFPSSLFASVLPLILYGSTKSLVCLNIR